VRTCHAEETAGAKGGNKYQVSLKNSRPASAKVMTSKEKRQERLRALQSDETVEGYGAPGGKCRYCHGLQELYCPYCTYRDSQGGVIEAEDVGAGL
jgi:hypothetical protein